MSTKTDRFDWQAIHRELEGRLSHLGSSIEDEDGRVQALLRQRAAQLAAAPRDARARDMKGRVIVMRIGAERYGLAIQSAQEVTQLTHTAILPGVGPAVMGVANWRGEFVTVFDLSKLLGVTPDEENAARSVIVLRGEEPRFALAVDGVEHIVELDLSTLQPADQLRVQRAGYFKGATADGMAVLDSAGLLAAMREDLLAA